ncbi:MAG: ABC transporter permease [Flavobacteriales bacterium]
MTKFWLITLRECKERLTQRGFWWMLVLGPLVVLLLLVGLLFAADQGKEKIKVLIADPGQIMEHKVLAQQEKYVSYYFLDSYLELNEFEKAKAYQEFDVLLELNEKVLNNKKCFVFYREQLSMDTRMQLKFEVERRLEEILANEFSALSAQAFRSIKQGLIFDFRDLDDPKNESKETSSWTGFAIGAFILLFVSIYGMTIFRATTKEKSSRIVEVLLASVKPHQLMMGKIAGIGIVALLQLIGWALCLGLGFWLLRSTLFVDILDPSNWQGTAGVRLNPLSDLIFEQLNFGFLLFHFLLFFIGSFFFYGALFSVLGSRSAADADGQQFLIPLLLLIVFGLVAGVFYILFPASSSAQLLMYLPFTSPVLSMIQLTQGATLESYVGILLSWFVLIVSAILLLWLASRWYKKSILKF